MDQHLIFKRSSSCDPDMKIAGLYDLGETIGQGHFAVVKIARHVFTGEKVAVKVINKTKLDAVSKEHLFQEVMCMKLVQHPNVVRLYEVIDTANKLYLVQELGEGGDMYDYIMKHEGGLNEEYAKRYFGQIVTAIAYCHKLHVVHRDLKPENVVFFEKLGIVKLTDFGFSNKFTPGQHLETSCGSLAYSAPEILLGDSYDAPKVDVWSLGVILYMLVCGRLPFQEANDSETLAKIMDCKYHLPESLSQECRSLIKRMLIRDPENRTTLDLILEDDWLRSASNPQMGIASVPLISREHISLEDHLDILNKMAEGNLSQVDDIQAGLDKNEYTYLTATYYLLAERKLKRHYIDQARRAAFAAKQESTNESSANVAEVTTPTHIPTSSSQSSVRVLEQSPGNDAPEERLRRFSMILEDEEEEEDEEVVAMASLVTVREELESALNLEQNDSGLLSGIAAPHPSRCASRTSATTTDHSDGGDSDVSSKATAVRNRQRKHRRQLQRPLVSAKSSPQLLKYIWEEDSNNQNTETGMSTSVSAMFEHTYPPYPPTFQMVKLRQNCSAKVSSPRSMRHFRRCSEGSGFRAPGASRSSSDNSDTEAETCASAARRSRGYRSGSRQDSDHSSDTDCGGGGGGVCGRRGSGSNGRLQKNGTTTGNGNGGNQSSSGGNSGGKNHSGSTGCVTCVPIPIVNVPVREKCTPISEEDEFRPGTGTANTSSQSRSSHFPPGAPPISGAGDLRRRSDSAECTTPARSSMHKLSNFSLSSTLTQSNFSLSSLTSLRGSKVMMEVIRGTFEAPCHHHSHHRHGKTRSVHSEMSSLRSLPEKVGTPRTLTPNQLHGSGTNFNNNSVHCSGKIVFDKARHRWKPKVRASCCKLS